MSHANATPQSSSAPALGSSKMNKTLKPASAYETAGVDTLAADAGMRLIADQIKTTWPQPGQYGAPQLDMRKFANVIDIGSGNGLALCTDGVGSKALIAQMLERYDTIGIDCVAMSVNDLICVGATPISMVDYISVEKLNSDILGEISKGLCVGAARAGVSIIGGETAELGDMTKGHTVGSGFDLVGMAVGTVDLDKILVGQDIEPGDIVIGLESNGIHSNGLALARKALFVDGNLTVDTTPFGFGRSLGEELLRPTHIYVKESLAVLDEVEAIKALIHITSDGFLNLTRVEAEVGYVINSLPPVPPIFTLIQRCGNVTAEEMYSVFNLGIGFCFVVGSSAADKVIDILRSHNRRAFIIGTVDANILPRHVSIPANDFVEYDLIGKDKEFHRADSSGNG